eukprot:1194428-Prorocentrum_minimum.AAC.4
MCPCRALRPPPCASPHAHPLPTEANGEGNGGKTHKAGTRVLRSGRGKKYGYRSANWVSHSNYGTKAVKLRCNKNNTSEFSIHCLTANLAAYPRQTPSGPPADPKQTLKATSESPPCAPPPRPPEDPRQRDGDCAGLTRTERLAERLSD